MERELRWSLKKQKLQTTFSLILLYVCIHTVQSELAFLGQQPFQAFVSQGVQSGETIYQFFVIDTQLLNEEQTEITFSSPQTNSLPFVLVPGSGQLLTIDVLVQNEYNFTVEASSETASIATQMIVHVIPLSDTSPRFEHAQYDVEVLENLPIRNAISVTRAFSLSLGATTQRYSIIVGNTNNDLSINSNSGILRVDRSFDRERTASYFLTVRYVDDFMSVDAAVCVTVLDVNDNSPQFSQPLYNVSIAETAAIGTSILTLSATDLDISPNDIITYHIDASANGTFTLDPQEGTLRTLTMLDYERQPKYQFRVTAVDGGIPPRSSIATVLVNLINIDDECPRFENPVFIEELAYDVTGTPPAVGTEILTVMATDPDRFSEVTYSIVSTNDVEHVLLLDSITGVVSLARTDIDPRGQYTLNVTASDQNCTLQSFVRVEIGIGNVNDHSPEFQTNCAAFLPENPPLGTAVVTLHATDDDIGYNGLVTYSLLSGTDVFAIDATSGVVRTNAPPESFDRETQSSFQVGVTASDGGNRQDYCLLIVTLMDVNDNPPQISLSHYSISLARGSQPGSFVVQVTAVDPDVGANGRISYSIETPSDSLPFPFQISSESGVILTTEAIQPTVNGYMFNVFATDLGEEVQLTSTATVSISLTDGDFFPVFDQFNYTGSVCENAQFQTIVLNVSASSSMVDELIVYEIIAGSDYRSNLEEAFVIRRKSNDLAEIRVGSNVIIDFERLAPNLSFQFFVQARNAAGGSLVPVEIVVNDIDDNSPRFLSDISITLPENEPIGTTVAQVQAVDLDSGTNGEVMYRLASASSSPYFNITSEGVIVSSHVFDFESSSQLLQGDIFIEAYNPNPLATDPVCTFQGFRDIGTAIIHWTILDQNDNPPAFQNSLYFTQVPENKAIQSKIYKLNVSDPDVSDRGRLRFSITSGNDGSFGIDSDYIVLTTRLDYEATPIYDLVIQVTDGVHSGQDCPGCVATVQITVTNVDDEPPVFSSLVYNADVIENAPVGSSILTLTATDIDSANILYELRGLAEGKFTVDQSGVITVSGEIDREEFPRGELVFLAFAEGGSLATADIVITILDVNDYVPRFTGLFRGRVEENTPPGEVGLYVGEVRAVDLDSGENGSISYSLVSGEDAGFTINSETGVITAHAQYDREVSPSYTITVEAKDNGTHVQLSSESLFLVEIGDVNDNKPFFPFSYMFARVFENSPLGTSVLVIPAIDPDNGTNATVTYTLESFSPSEVKFELNPATGEVTVAGSLDYEIPQHRFYTLTFSLRDARFVSDSRGTLQIELLDVNDNTPSIDLVIQTNSNLQETFPPGAVVATVTASDQDTGINAELVYEISTGNENGDFQLSVEGNVASIVTINQFDYESRSSYTLLVSVSDRGTPQREASTELVFNIIDVNDQPPMFTDSVYSVSIPENSNVTESLLLVEAVDRDTGSGGLVVRYEILNGNEGSWFSLSSGGVLRSLVMFDREERSSYSLTIIAFDGGAVPLNGTARIEVTIADVNDNPSFNGGHLTVFVYALNGHAAIGDIAPLYFIDPDIDDQFIACIIQAQSHSGLIFDIDASTCTLQLLVDNPPVDIYTFQRVLGRDGVHATVITGATIVVEHLASSELPRDHLVTLTLNASSEAFFQERLNETFPVELAGVLGIQEENLHLITVQPGHFLPDSTVDVTFTVRDRNGIYLEPTEIIQQLYLNRDSLAPGNHSILDLPVDVCVNEPCQNQAACRNTMTIVGTDKVSSTREFVLLAPKIEFGYECVCVPGTSGEHCEINFNDCYSNPCLYGAQCTDEVNVFSCDCPAGRGGQDCSFISDRCITSPCLNGGSCMTGIDSYICDCLLGYYGPECQYHYFRPSSFCAPNNPCQNGAECSAGRDSFTCVCLLGFMGDFCETETQLQGGCIGNPCYNGSTCNATDQGPVCMCSTGFVGPNCQWPLNNCELGLCLNGASCEQGLYGSYRCACMPGFTGENCDLPIPACSSNPCLNQGRCLDNQDGTHTCQCVPGYYGDNCEFSIHPVDLCLMDVCSVDSNCTSGRDSYTCSCDEGFSGPDCSILGEVGSNVQPCSVNPCLYGGECVDESTQQAGYSCRCAVGFTGADCEDNINDCSTSPCINGGMCTDGINGYICSCPSHLTGNECQIYCPEGYSGTFCQTPVSQCTPNPCENGSTCVEEAVGFMCVCPPTHTGSRCEILNNCADNMCSNGGTCIDLEGGGFNCDCSQDFKGEKCELLTVSFSGSQGESSYRAFDSLEIRGQGRIEFEFATVDDNGLLLYNTQYQNGKSKDFIAVEIVDGVLRVAISHGNEDSGVLVMSNYVVVTDGLWHRVSIDTRGKVFRALLDDCFALQESLLPFASCAVTGTTTGTNSFLDLGLPLWVGGVPFSSSHVSSQGITGCMRGVRINGQLVDLEGYLFERNSQRGCSQLEPEDCISNSSICGGGSCVSEWEGYSCQCTQRMEGESCQRVTTSLKLGGETYAQYSLLGTGDTAGTKRQTVTSVRSTITDQISLWFRTEMGSGRGLLFYMGNLDSGEELYIQLEEGVPVLHVNLGSGEEQLPLINITLADSIWHFIVVKRSALDLATTVDNVTDTHTLQGSDLTLDINPSEIYAGGRPSTSTGGVSLILTPYIGCLEDIRIDQDQLPTSDSNSFASVLFAGSSEISYNCALGRCLTEPCGRGNCSERGTENYACSCEIGITTFSHPCPLEVPPPMFTLAIVFGAVAGGLLICVVTILFCMLWIRRRLNRKHSMVLDSCENSSQGTLDLLNRQCLVISNEAGGGEQDTVMGMDEWSKSLAPDKQRGKEENKSTSSSSNTSITKPAFLSLARANSPTISAFIHDKIEAVPKEYRDMDSICEYKEEGTISHTGSLSSICSSVDSEYTVERLRQAGPEFAPFVGLLASVLEEEETIGNDCQVSELAHTGNTQTQATQYSQEFW